MLQLSINVMPRELYPQPLLKPNYNISELNKIRKDIIRQEFPKSQQENTRSRSLNVYEQVSRNKGVIRGGGSPKCKPLIERAWNARTIHVKTSQTDGVTNALTLQQEQNIQKFTEQCLQAEESFQTKQDTIRQTIKCKLYQSYANTLRSQRKQNAQLKLKMSQLESQVPESIRIISPTTKKLQYLLKMQRTRSDYEPMPIVSINNQSLPHLDHSYQTIDEYLPKASIKETTEHYRIINKVRKTAQKILSSHTPIVDTQPIFKLQTKLLHRAHLGNSTKNRLIESFNDILKMY